MKTKKKSNSRRAFEIGGVVTAAVLAAAAGAYLLSNKKTKAKAKAWMSQARTEIAKRAKATKRLGETEYKRIVEKTVKRYGSLENISAADIIQAGKEFKAEWKNIQQHAKKIVATVKTSAKRKAKPARRAKQAKKKARR